MRRLIGLGIGLRDLASRIRWPKFVEHHGPAYAGFYVVINSSYNSNIISLPTFGQARKVRDNRPPQGRGGTLYLENELTKDMAVFREPGCNLLPASHVKPPSSGVMFKPFSADSSTTSHGYQVWRTDGKVLFLVRGKL